MTEQLQAEIAIVGGGIVGSSAALALRRMGYSVVLLERGFCGAAASGVNYGGVRRQGRALVQMPLTQRAHAIWSRLGSLVGTEAEYVRSGHLKLARSEADMAALEAYAELVRDAGLGLQLLGSRALREHCPALGPRAVGGSLCPEDGHANPRLVAPAFARAARRAGADVRERTEVQALAHDGRRFVLQARGQGRVIELRAEHLLNCAGAWSGFVAAHFGEQVPLTSGNPLMAVTEPLPPLMSFSLGVEGGGIYARQVGRGNIVFGGGRGIALDERFARPAQAALLATMRQAAELLPVLCQTQVIRSWSGTEGYLPDHQPVIGPSATTPGLVHGFGFCGAGFQIGPAVGEVLAELVRDGRSSTPIAAFAIDRFRHHGATAGAAHAAATPV